MPEFGKEHQPAERILHREQSSFPSGLLSEWGGRTDGFCVQSPDQGFNGMCSVFSSALLNSTHLQQCSVGGLGADSMPAGIRAA